MTSMGRGPHGGRTGPAWPAAQLPVVVCSGVASNQQKQLQDVQPQEQQGQEQNMQRVGARRPLGCLDAMASGQ